jgi:hypothetical protein
MLGESNRPCNREWCVRSTGWKSWRAIRADFWRIDWSGDRFTAGFLGAVFGHWWDDPSETREKFGSAVLTVVGGFFELFFVLLALNFIVAHPELAKKIVAEISGSTGFLTSLSRSLIDDWNAQKSALSKSTMD